MKEKLLSRIAERKITVGVVGLGYVGLPLAVEKAKAGFRTIGFDVQEEKVKQVNAGHNYIGDVVDAELAQLVRNGTLSATSDFSFIKDVDFVAICVPTPLDVHQEPDISYVESSAKSIAGHLTAGTIVVLESTTYPGTTEELIKPILESGSGLKCGKDFYLGFSPERVDPGNAVYKTKNTPKVVGAVGKDAQDVIAAMYGAVLGDKVHVVSSPAVAEMTKILENTYRNINIGLINELAILCNRMDIDLWEVIEAAKNQPFRLHRILSRTGAGRALHSPGPLLSHLEGARVRLPYIDDRGFHDDKRPHARIHRGALRQDTQPPPQGIERLQSAGARRGIQAGYRRLPRESRPACHRGAGENRGVGHLLRPLHLRVPVSRQIA